MPYDEYGDWIPLEEGSTSGDPNNPWSQPPTSPIQTAAPSGSTGTGYTAMAAPLDTRTPADEVAKLAAKYGISAGETDVANLAGKAPGDYNAYI